MSASRVDWRPPKASTSSARVSRGDGQRSRQALIKASLAASTQDEQLTLAASEMLSCGLGPSHDDSLALELALAGSLTLCSGKKWIECEVEFDSDKCRLRLSSKNGNVEADVDVQAATFNYDVGQDNLGQFTISVPESKGDLFVRAGSHDRRLHWLHHLQRARRQFNRESSNNVRHASSVRRSSSHSKMGLIGRGSEEEVTLTSMATTMSTTQTTSTSSSSLAPRQSRAPLSVSQGDLKVDRCLSGLDVSSPPKSADYIRKPSFFQSLSKHQVRGLRNMPRSASVRTPSPPPTTATPTPTTTGISRGLTSPTRALSASSSSIVSVGLSRLRRSIRESSKRPSHLTRSTALQGCSSGVTRAVSVTGASWSPKRGHGHENPEVISLREDLMAAKDEAAAAKEVINVLKKQVDAMHKEKETLESLQRPDLLEGDLLSILRSKDARLVDLETSAQETQRVVDLQECELQKLRDDLATFRHMLEAKDEVVVRLTNQIHEMELNQVQNASPASRTTPNGLSFDSDRFEFREFVNVATQTDADAEREHLSDAVDAYAMQNTFLNKELLELNHIRQQGIEREHRLHLTASEWEAKFYQIQSKYLLLLNELHNPQVSVSASRQEMVSHLLKDIVEASEKSTSKEGVEKLEYDHFGFELINHVDVEDVDQLDEKAERLRRKAELQSQSINDNDESKMGKWEEIVNALNAANNCLGVQNTNNLVASNDIKKMLRKGIPSNQRSQVWKAIVDAKISRATLQGASHYYQKLLSNYHVSSRSMTPAAKQIELDLLRTLPHNRHYNAPQADGIAKLRRVLIAYSVHNPDVEYCQGFNRIAAIALLFVNEEDAFWILVGVVEHLMPANYYSRDQQLIGAQVDQEVLKELLHEKLPRLSHHLRVHGVDPSLFSLNWFLCLFVDSLPVHTYLRIWDAFLLEGCKVLFRYALAIFKLMEERIMEQTEHMAIFNCLREGTQALHDVDHLTKIAFHDLNPFPLRHIQQKRETHYKLIESKKRELDDIRLNYRKNSLARSPNTSGPVSMSKSLVAATTTEELSEDEEETNEDIK